MKKLKLIFCMVGMMILVGCSENSQNITKESQQPVVNEEKPQQQSLEIRFGEDSPIFILELEENTTAQTIARYVGQVDWNLPIYHFDDYENYEVMQYYDIPSSYEIPDNSQQVTSQKAGEAYYSHPNRIVLFYQDAEVPGEYTKIGTLVSTDELVDAVNNNPVVPGWSNKIVSISPRQ